MGEISENTIYLNYGTLYHKRYVKLMVLAAGTIVSLAATILLIYNVIITLVRSGGLLDFIITMGANSFFELFILIIECALPMIVFIIFLRNFLHVLPEFKAIKNKQFEIRTLNSMFSKVIESEDDLEDNPNDLLTVKSQDKNESVGNSNTENEDSKELNSIFGTNTYKVKFMNFEEIIEVFKVYELENVEEFYAFYYKTGELMMDSKNLHRLVFLKKQTALDGDLHSLLVE